MQIARYAASTDETLAMIAELQAGGRTSNEQAREDARIEASQRAAERTTTMSVTVQQYDVAGGGDALVWPEPVASQLTHEQAAQHRKDLRSRRRGRNLVVLPDGLEFNTYAAGCHPHGCPEMAGSRTRVTFSGS